MVLVFGFRMFLMTSSWQLLRVLGVRHYRLDRRHEACGNL